MNVVRLNLKPLRALRAKVDELATLRAQVGLFEETSGRSADAGRIQDNPSLGVIHEFGTDEIPERSFLRMPLMLHLGSTMTQLGTNWFALLMKRGARRTMALFGVMGEEVVQESFATGGWGAWPALSPKTIRRKGSSAILIESAQMRKAVGSRVV